MACKRREKMKQGRESSSEAELPQPAKMVNLIEYQKGSVVSRTLIDKKAGTVTLFSFDKGEGLSEHTAPFDALVYVVEDKHGIWSSEKQEAHKEN
jgi:quercetin dioxygenase-like cupin family protein